MLQMLTTAAEWLAVANDFEQKWNYPHVIGAIDGKHVVLQKPVSS